MRRFLRPLSFTAALATIIYADPRSMVYEIKNHTFSTLGNFENKKFRDLNADKRLAISSNGDLIDFNEIPVLKGKNLTSIKTKGDSTLCLARNGSVYLDGKQMKYSGGWFEKVVEIGFGDSAIARTNHGRVLELVDDEFKEIKELKAKEIVKIATGSNHSLYLTKDGQVFSRGSNSHGQLGLSIKSLGAVFNEPQDVKNEWKSPKSGIKLGVCTKIFAGANNSFFVFEDDQETVVYSCGFGLNGQLGNGGFFQVSTLTKVNGLSLKEYSESENRLVPIKIHDIKASDTHAVGVLDSGANKDVLMWGQGQFRLDEKKGPSSVPLHCKSIGEPERLQLSKDQDIAVGNGVTILQKVIDRELAIAKEQLVLKNHHAARLALSKKKYQEQLLEKTGNQLMTIEQLTQSIEYALVEQDILNRLQLGNTVLEQIHQEMSIEKVEKIMDDTADAIQYQNEIQEIISKELNEEDEEEIMAELDRLIEEEALEGQQEIKILPNVPKGDKVEQILEDDKQAQVEALPKVPVKQKQNPAKGILC
ncbi:hypothetical protein HK103_001550 [Boothiomyces macroporosus]|uniref:Uncharacterized protein n=1 Tax=Boothiomyces macroporosus TaxID=261099 RepID=A0AAD5UEJ6_9FUNG|nr:hypothetical protein HK103_001550 [Boothiomyces macroporosus]